MIKSSHILFLAASTVLSAQDAHLGLALDLLVPVGSFRSTTYAPTTTVLTPQTEGHDIGLGAQFTASFPLDQKTAVRLNVNGHSTNGTNTAPEYETLNLEHDIFSIGVEMQFFGGSAFRHRGPYFFAGLSADFESFSHSTGESGWHDRTTTRKSRLGGTIGAGRAFGYQYGYRFTMEVAYHKTLEGYDTARNNPPATDFLKLSFGWTF